MAAVLSGRRDLAGKATSYFRGVAGAAGEVDAGLV
jgi:hypothetical protein